MPLVELAPPFAATLPFTRYFEVDSWNVGARFAVWVTVPAMYGAHLDRHYPVIYLPDGNLTVPQTASQMLEFDPINPISPFVHVGVGYVGEDARRMIAVRARDLLPPDEPLPTGTIEASMKWLYDAGVLDRFGLELYACNLKNPAADHFLAFLTEELHPFLAEYYRIETDTAGLYGYSYGGLFATFVALRRSPLFHRVGAGSPGILAGTSKVFQLYEAEVTAGADHTGRMLHMTVCEPELTVRSCYQHLVGRGTTEFLALADQRPLKGLGFSSRIIEHESHASGFVPSWFSFLRACYAVR
jgi:predicted alpha/beta superfamily hydrolase